MAESDKYCCVGCLLLAKRLGEQTAEIVRLQGMIGRDAVTGAASRSQMAHLWERVVAQGEAALLFLDVDRFKAINDRWGHLVGDAVLGAVVHRILGVLRPQDVCLRYGGEEFMVFLAAVGAQQAEAVAERIRVAIAFNPVTGEEWSVPVTVSIGVVPTHEESPDLASLIAVADQALYQAKAQGRNQVVVRW